MVMTKHEHAVLVLLLVAIRPATLGEESVGSDVKKVGGCDRVIVLPIEFDQPTGYRRLPQLLPAEHSPMIPSVDGDWKYARRPW
jgi:hypothetical protein